MTEIKTPEQIISEAIDIMAQGWCKGFSYKKAEDGTDLYCAYGALTKAAYGTAVILDGHPNSRAYWSAVGRIREQFDHKDTIDVVNDHPDTTFEDMALYMKRAIGDQ